MAAPMIYQIDNRDWTAESLMVNETVFHNANGYIGIRSNYEEGYPEEYTSIRGSYINGFYDFTEMSQAEKLCGLVEEKQTILNIADTQTVELFVGEERFSPFVGTVKESKRYLDMEKGITGRTVRWTSPSGKEVDVHIKRMTSFEKLSLFTLEYEVTSINFTGQLRFVSTHNGAVQNFADPNDPRVAGESKQYLFVDAVEENSGASFIVAHTSKSNLTVCTAVKNELVGGVHELRVEKEQVVDSICVDVSVGQTITLQKYTVFTDSVRSGDCLQAAKEELLSVLAKPLTHWYQAQCDYLATFWEQSALEIEGDDDLALATRYNQYQLLQSVAKDEHCNIAAKGLSGEGYEGHYFWDTEMYIQPFFTLTNPTVSKALVEYRYSILDYARENAKILGHRKGALYPWRTIMGKECSGYFPSGTAQYHINGDVAFAVVAYYLASGDDVLMMGKGAEILFEIARLWMDVGHFYKGKFVINDVTGPDEYTCIVNNNYFTNASAQYSLHWAVKCYQMIQRTQNSAGLSLLQKLDITEAEVETFALAEKKMYLPYDAELGINPQDDSFLQKEVWDIAATPKDHFPLLLHYHPLTLYRYQVCKQADTVLSHFVFEDAQSLETMRNSFLYYEKVTTHDSSLSTCIFSIVASRLGLTDKAYAYFGDSAKLDLFNTHHNTKDGIHTANMGGNYMAIVYGFAGLRLKESGLSLRPSLPKGWTSYRFRLTYRGRRLEVKISKDGTTIQLLQGDTMDVFVNDKRYRLVDGITVK